MHKSKADVDLRHGVHDEVGRGRPGGSGSPIDFSNDYRANRDRADQLEQHSWCAASSACLNGAVPGAASGELRHAPRGARSRARRATCSACDPNNLTIAPDSVRARPPKVLIFETDGKPDERASRIGNATSTRPCARRRLGRRARNAYATTAMARQGCENFTEVASRRRTQASPSSPSASGRPRPERRARPAGTPRTRTCRTACSSTNRSATTSRGASPDPTTAARRARRRATAPSTADRRPRTRTVTTTSAPRAGRELGRHLHDRGRRQVDRGHQARRAAVTMGLERRVPREAAGARTFALSGCEC